MKIVQQDEERVVPANELLGLLKDVQKKGGSIKFVATGYSMKPSIRHNDIIRISPVSAQDLNIGDIVIYQKNVDSQVVVHRVVKSKNGKFLMMGDNSNEEDGWITTAEIHGIVTAVIRGGKPVRIFSSSGNKLTNNVRFFFFNLFLLIRRIVSGVVFKMRKRG